MSYCDDCRKETRWITVQRAMEIVQRSRQSIYRWIEEERVHVRVLPSGRGKRVCENSLLQKPTDE
jgi:predicted DNA-binding transcriptional regulator AlpA